MGWSRNLRQQWRLLRFSLIAIDSVALGTAVAGAALIRLSLEDLLPVSALATDRHLVASVLVIPVLLVLFHVQGLYKFDQILVGTREYMLIVHSATYGVLIAVAVSYFGGGGPLVSRSWMLLVWILTVALVGGSRFTVRRVVRRLKQHGWLRTRVAIVGASSLGVDIARQLLASGDEGIDIVGFFDEYLPIGEPLVDGVGVVGRPLWLTEAEGAVLADEYILVPAALPHQRLEEIMHATMIPGGPLLRLAVSSSELLTHGVQVVQRGGVPLVTAHRACITGVDATLKRTLDLVVASLMVLALAPITGLLAVRGFLTRPGSVIRRRRVCGTRGEPVALWLFEPSITKWLPLRGSLALTHVITGSFSLVGPRPVEWDSARALSSALGFTAAKPGLTGPWRLSGPETSLEHQSILDLAYVRNYSIWEDLRILYQSVRRLRGAAQLNGLARWYDEQPDQSQQSNLTVDALLASVQLR